MKKLLSILLVVVLSMAAFVGCNNVTDTPVEITLSETEITLAIGDQHSLTATVTGSEESVTWASSNTSVVKVNKFGQLQVLALGTADITATIGKDSAKCTVTVNPVLTADATAITLIAPVEGLNLGVDLISKKVSYTANPELQAGEELTYASSNDAVAVVEEIEVAEGATELRIVAKSVGSATITATAPNGAKAEVAVTVESLNAEPTALTFEITTAVAVPEWCGVFLAGTLSAWGPAEGFELERVNETTFKGTFNFDFSEAGDAARNAEYKFILSSIDENGNFGSDTGWEQVNGSNVENRKIFVNYDETIKIDGVIFQSVPANPEKPMVENTINVTLKTGTDLGKDALYLAGPFGPEGDPAYWNCENESFKFTKVNDTTYTLTFVVTTKSETLECKITDGTWDWTIGYGSAWEVGGANNGKINLLGDIVDGKRNVDVEINLGEEAILNLTVVFANAIEHDLYLVGTINSWNPCDENLRFTASADKKTFTLSVAYTGDSYELKLTNGTWDWNYGSSDGIEWTQNGANYVLNTTGGAMNVTWNIAN